MIKETTLSALGTDLSPDDRAVLAAYWRGRGEGEMGAEIAFRQVREDMEILGAPASLLAIAERAIQDERKHGHWGRDYALRFGGTDTSEPVASRTRLLEFPRASSRDNRVLRIAFCCFNETVGCHVLQDVRPRITTPDLRSNNQQHLADELQHARVGWGFLSILGPADRALVHRYRKILLRMVQIAACEGGEKPEFDHLVPYGYFTPQVLKAGYERAVAEVIDPGLAHLAITEAA